MVYDEADLATVVKVYVYGLGPFACRVGYYDDFLEAGVFRPGLEFYPAAAVRVGEFARLVACFVTAKDCEGVRGG